jgi:hypothetical protein
MSRLILKQLNVIERRSLLSATTSKRAFTQVTSRRSVLMATPSSAAKRLTQTKNFLAPSTKKVNTQMNQPKDLFLFNVHIRCLPLLLSLV